MKKFALAFLCGIGLFTLVAPVGANTVLYNYSGYLSATVSAEISDSDYLSLTAPAAYGSYSVSASVFGETVDGSLFSGDAEVDLSLGSGSIRATLFADGWGYDTPDAYSRTGIAFDLTRASIWSLEALGSYEAYISFETSTGEPVYVARADVNGDIDDYLLVTLGVGSYSLYVSTSNWYDTSVGQESQVDFRLNFVEPTVVPVLPSLPLFVSGLSGVAFLARRRIRNH